MGPLADAYRSWILAQDIEGCKLSEDSGNVVIEGDLVKGWVGFYDIDDMDIVELRLERVVDEEPVFFLHFELEDLLRAQALFDEMREAIDDMTHTEVRHVLLCCTCGVTTTYFASKMNEAAEAEGLAYDFCALPIEEAKRNGASYAAVLLAPQVGHQRKAVAEALPDVPVIEIPGKVFGSYDAASAVHLVVGALTGNRFSSNDEGVRPVRDLDRTKRVLVVSYVRREDEPTLSYRIFDRGTVALSGMLVHRTFDVKALSDLAATLLVQGWKISDFDAVGVAVPGVVDNGVVASMQGGVESGYDLAQTLRDMWGTEVYVDSTASAAAVGCYVNQKEYENVAFHAQTVGVAEGVEGYVIHGQPMMGHAGRAGHLGPVLKGFLIDLDIEDAAWRVNGMRKLVGRYLSCLACTVAPDVVYVWCDLLPDMDELHDELATMLPESAIPKLVGVADYDEFVLVGELSLCLRRLAAKKA